MYRQSVPSAGDYCQPSAPSFLTNSVRCTPLTSQAYNNTYYTYTSMILFSPASLTHTVRDRFFRCRLYVAVARSRAASPVFRCVTRSLPTAIPMAFVDPTSTTAFFARVIAVYSRFLCSIM